MLTSAFHWRPIMPLIRPICKFQLSVTPYGLDCAVLYVPANTV